MHKSIIEVLNPDDVDMRLTIVARVSTLRRVRDVLGDWDANNYDRSVAEFLGSISDAVRQVDEKFVGLESIPDDGGTPLDPPPSKR